MGRQNTKNNLRNHGNLELTPTQSLLINIGKYRFYRDSLLQKKHVISSRWRRLQASWLRGGRDPNNTPGGHWNLENTGNLPSLSIACNSKTKPSAFLDSWIASCENFCVHLDGQKPKAPWNPNISTSSFVADIYLMHPQKICWKLKIMNIFQVSDLGISKNPSLWASRLNRVRFLCMYLLSATRPLMQSLQAARPGR